jgi:hypothetical protein
MDTIDAIGLMLWSVGLWSLDFTAGWMLVWQTAYLAAVYVGRRIVSIRFERHDGRYTHD